MWTPCDAATHKAPGFKENDNFGLELFLPNMTFCSSLTLFSCSLRIRWRSSSISRCSSMMAKRSSAYRNIEIYMLVPIIITYFTRQCLTNFLCASSILRLFSAKISSSSSRFCFSSSYKTQIKWGINKSC